MNRRGFLAALAALPAALLAGIRPARLKWTSLDPPLLGTSPIRYSLQPFLDYQRKEIARIFRVPVSLINDAGDGGAFGMVEGTEAEIAELERKWIEVTRGPQPAPTEKG
jgi:hypothetical protein